PRIGVITAIPERPVHFSRTPSVEAIASGKAELIAALPDDGLALLHAAAPRVRALADRTRARVALFGESADAAVRATEVVADGLDGAHFVAHLDGRTAPVRLPLPGRHVVPAALAALGAATALGVPLDEAATALATMESPPHRMSVRRGHGIVVIDDSYNASPAAVSAALAVLGSVRSRRVAVIGDMLELGALSADLLGLVVGGPYIRRLRRLRMGKQVRREGPPSHLVTKQGLVTFGGVLFIGVVAVLWLFVLVLLPEDQRGDYVPQTIVPMGTLLVVGLLGAIDDYVNVVYGFGIRGRHKLVWQAIVGIVAAIYIQRHFGVTGILIPLYGEWLIGAVPFVILAVFAMVAMSNGVNLTDGLDGLGGSTAVFAFLSFAFIAAARGYPWLVVFCGAIVGALLAFLWFNVHPAEFMMGDTGSLALGATLTTVALTTG